MDMPVCWVFVGGLFIKDIDSAFGWSMPFEVFHSGFIATFIAIHGGVIIPVGFGHMIQSELIIWGIECLNEECPCFDFESEVRGAALGAFPAIHGALPLTGERLLGLKLMTVPGSVMIG